MGKAICSPSGQGYINQCGEVKVLSTQEQIIINKGQYMGCVFPAPTIYLPQISEALKKVGKTLYANNVRGTFGIDFIGFENGNLLATEINVRKVGPSHAFNYVKSIIGNEVNLDGFLINKNGMPIYYVHRRFYEPSLLKYLEPKIAVEVLRKNNLLYHHIVQTGAILHILGALKSCGYLEITSIENSRDKAFELDNRVQLTLLDEAKSLIEQAKAYTINS